MVLLACSSRISISISDSKKLSYLCIFVDNQCMAWCREVRKASQGGPQEINRCLQIATDATVSRDPFVTVVTLLCLSDT